MPRGAPDWGHYAQQDLLTKTFDLGELAARLKSPSIYDRGGSVIFMDNFDDGYSRWSRTAVTNCQIVLSHAKTFSGGYSTRFAFSAQTSSFAEIATSVPYFETARYGLETIFLLNSASIYLYAGFRLLLNNYYYRFYWYLEPNNYKLYIYTPSGNVQMANDLLINSAGYQWVFTKMIIDADALKYSDLKVNERSFNLSGYSPHSASQSGANELGVIVQAKNAGTSSADLYIGSIIVTVNE